MNDTDSSSDDDGNTSTRSKYDGLTMQALFKLLNERQLPSDDIESKKEAIERLEVSDRLHARGLSSPRIERFASPALHRARGTTERLRSNSTSSAGSSSSSSSSASLLSAPIFPSLAKSPPPQSPIVSRIAAVSGSGAVSSRPRASSDTPLASLHQYQKISTDWTQSVPSPSTSAAAAAAAANKPGVATLNAQETKDHYIKMLSRLSAKMDLDAELFVNGGGGVGGAPAAGPGPSAAAAAAGSGTGDEGSVYGTRVSAAVDDAAKTIVQSGYGTIPTAFYDDDDNDDDDKAASSPPQQRQASKPKPKVCEKCNDRPVAARIQLDGMHHCFFCSQCTALTLKLHELAVNKSSLSPPSSPSSLGASGKIKKALGSMKSKLSRSRANSMNVDTSSSRTNLSQSERNE